MGTTYTGETTQRVLDISTTRLKRMFVDLIRTAKMESAYGELLIPLILEKLPTDFHRTLYRIRGDTPWTLPDLRKAILTEIKVNHIGDFDNHTRQTPTIATFHTSTRGGERTAPPFNTRGGRRSTTRQTYSSPPCTYCKGGHTPNDCVVVSDFDSRLDIVKRNKLCFNCLGNHVVNNCRSKYSCRHCQKKHHTSLHDKSKDKEITNRSHSNTSHSSNKNTHVKTTYTSVPGRGTLAHTCNHTDCSSTLVNENPTDPKVSNNSAVFHSNSGNVGYSQRPVLLKTAKINVSYDNNMTTATVLFDEGANRSFITENLASKIPMTTTNPEIIPLSAFGSKQAERRILQSATLNLHPLDGTVSQMNALLIPEISANMENYVTSDLLELPHLRDLVLAHPINDKEPNFDIDILIGADYYWQYVTDRVVRGDGPTAVMSPFGYLLSGPKPCGNTSSTTNMLHVLINMPSPIKEIVDEQLSIAVPRKVEMITASTLYTRESLRPVNEGSSNAAPPAASTHYERRSSQLDNGPSDHETENNNANSASRITNSELHVYNVCETSEHSPSLSDDVSVNILHSANQPLGELIPPLSINATSDTLPRHDSDLLMNDADDEPNEPNINLENIIDPTRFSTLQRLLRVTVLIRRFVDKLRRRISTANSSISAEEIAKAEKTWVSDLQQRHFADSFTTIRHNNKRFGVLVRQLRLFIDDDGVLRCGSRLHNADVNFTTKFPALLPSKHYFTTLLVRREHERLHHSGTQAVVTAIRQQYWITNIRQTVNYIIRRCVT
uniref:Uncharacterized protein LOC102806767 n=1 Tax=Saccoglossus kowalevskii TaxID=10224 RepID=A0ABM0M187_SACKO